MILNNGMIVENSVIIEEAINYARHVDPKPLVVVRCLTYNQNGYVSQMLDGLLAQETSFSYVAIVHDDASTDGTANTVNRYSRNHPGVIQSVCDVKNRYTEQTLGPVMDAITDEYNPSYIALCEGDDCWSNPLKLQTQVEYMENHPECVMCHGDFEVINGMKRRHSPHYDNEPYFGPGHIHNYSICTLTVLIRYDVYKRIPQHRYTNRWLMGDLPLWIELSKEGSFHYIPEVLGKYRELPNSASHSSDVAKIKEFWNSRNDIYRFYSILYGYDYTAPSYKSLYWLIQRQCYKNHDKNQARQYWKEAKECNGNSLRTFMFYFCNIYNARWVIKLLYKLL